MRQLSIEKAKEHFSERELDALAYVSEMARVLSEAEEFYPGEHAELLGKVRELQRFIFARAATRLMTEEDDGMIKNTSVVATPSIKQGPPPT